MFNVFGWLRAQAKAAVLGGISDALADVQVDDKPADLDALRAKLAAVADVKALPAAKVDDEPEPSGKRGKVKV